MSKGPEYWNILEHSLVGVYQTNFEGKCIFMNNVLINLLEYDSMEDFNAHGGAPAAYKNSLDRKKLIEEMKKEGHVEGREFEFITKNGKQKFVTLYMRLENNILSGTIVDVTKYKDIQIKLQESQERFRQLFEHTPSGVAVYRAIDNGSNFIFVDFNSSAEKIEKVKRDEIIGKCVTEIFPGVKEFGIFESFQRVWKTGKTEFLPAKLYKDEFWHSGWRENWIYKLPSGEIVAIYNDVTEHKKADEKLVQNLHYLEVFYKSSIGREERVIELKEKIKKLEEELKDLYEKK